MHKFPFLLVVIAVVGCATAPTVKMEPENSNLGNTTIIRNFNFLASGVHYWPTVDGEAVAGIFGKQYVSFDLPVGVGTIGVKCCLGFLNPWLHDELKVAIKDGSPRYYLLSPSIFRLGYAEIEEISKDDATDRIVNSKRMPTGTVSDCDGEVIGAQQVPPTVCFSRAVP